MWTENQKYDGSDKPKHISNCNKWKELLWIETGMFLFRIRPQSIQVFPLSKRDGAVFYVKSDVFASNY